MPMILFGLFGLILLFFGLKALRNRAALKAKQQELEDVQLQGDVLDLDEAIVNKKMEHQKRNAKLNKAKGKLNND